MEKKRFVRNHVANEVNWQAVDLYNAGSTLHDICQQLYLSGSTLNRIITAARTAGLITREKHQPGRSKDRGAMEARIGELYEMYVPLANIGRDVGLSASAVKRIVRRLREAGKIRRPPWHDMRQRRALSRYRRLLKLADEDMLSAAEIAKREKIAINTVRGTLRKARRAFPESRLARRDNRKRLKKKYEELRDDGWTQRRIADMLPVSRSTLDRWRREID